MPAQESKVPSKATGKFLSKVHEMKRDDGDESRDESHDVVYGVEVFGCGTTGHEGETAFLGKKPTNPPDVAAPASAHRLCDQNGAGTAASAFNGHAFRAHEQGGLHPRAAELGRGGPVSVDHPRNEGEDSRDQGGTRHVPSELREKEHSLPSVGHRNEVQQEEGRPTGVHQNPPAAACDRKRDHCPAPEGMPSQDLRDHTTDSSRPHGFWSPQCPVIRGAVHDGARLCEMGAADSLRGPRRLPAVAPGEVVGEPPSRTNQRGQESSECKDSGSSEANSSSGICRIRQQLEVERGPDPDDPVSPRGGCSSPGGTPSQEGREARRTDDRGLLQGPLSLSTPEPESQALSDRICQFQCTIDVSQGATWEPLPEHKARQLAFQSDDMLPEAFGSLVSEGRLVVPHLWPLLCDATNQPAYPKAV